MEFSYSQNKVLAKNAYAPVRRRNIIDPFIVLAILIFLVNPFFKFYRIPVLLISVFLMLRLVIINKGDGVFSVKIMWLFLIYSTLAIIQGVIWKFSVVSLMSSFLYGFYIPYLLYINYGIRFLDLLERVVYKLTILAIVMWLGINFLTSFRELVISLIDSLHAYSSDSIVDDNMKRSLIFYTYIYDQDAMSNGLYRNSGFAHEPGAFAFFICFMVYYNYLKKLRFFSLRILVYMAALLTTFSTAGYIAFFLVLLIFLLNSKHRIWTLLVLPILLFQAYSFYTSAEFMQEKIENQINTQSEVNLQEQTTGRLYGTRKSLYVLGKYPLHGRGLLAVSRPDSSMDMEYASYGFLSEVARFGLLVGSIGLFFFIKGFVKLSRLYSANGLAIILGVLSLFVGLSAQVFITHPVIFVLFFIGSSKLNYNE